MHNIFSILSFFISSVLYIDQGKNIRIIMLDSKIISSLDIII